MKLLCTLIAAALLAGCATPLPTSSGRPEITVAAPAEKLRAEITNEMINRGYVPRPGDNFNLVFDKDGGMTASVFLGSTMDPQVIKRCTFTIIDLGEQRRVVGSFSMISASTPRGGEAPGRAYPQMQHLLETVRARLTGEPPPAPLPELKLPPAPKRG